MSKIIVLSHLKTRHLSPKALHEQRTFRSLFSFTCFPFSPFPLLLSPCSFPSPEKPFLPSVGLLWVRPANEFHGRGGYSIRFVNFVQCVSTSFLPIPVLVSYQYQFFYHYQFYTNTSASFLPVTVFLPVPSFYQYQCLTRTVQ